MAASSFFYMTTSLFLSEADIQRLETLLTDQLRGPRATPEQKQILQGIISTARQASLEASEASAGFGDRVSLVSPVDARDSFNLTVVLPSEEDVDHERISILQPVSLAVIGRSCGDVVEWETPAGHREMKIAAVAKSDRGPSPSPTLP